MKLFGRRQEKTELERVLDGARRGTGSALMFWGDPGIGKTALLEYATSTAADFTVLCCRGTRMESGLAFAALHELLWPVIDRIDALPAPQAAALHGALGRSGEAANRFLIGAATLTLLSDFATERPLLITVDDADLLDEPTAECLAFIARRLRTEPIAMLLAGHEDPAHGGPWEQISGVEVTPLSDTDASDYVRHEVAGADADTVRRTVRMAAGNPLALRELPGINDDDGERAPVGPLLRRAFSARTARLTPAARTLLLVAAAENRGDARAIREAAATLGAGPAAWDEAQRSGLLVVADGRTRFRTPLISAVVYEEAPFPERQAAHRALAQTMRGQDNEGLRAWHLAAAADETDEEIAALLENHARDCWRRGGYATAARAMRRAAALSPLPADAGRRLALGARSGWEAGQVDTARELLDRADRLASAEAVALGSGGLRGIIEFACGDQGRANRLLLRDTHSVAHAAEAVELACLAIRAGWSGGSVTSQADALHRLAELATDAEFPEVTLLSTVEQWWSTGPGPRPVPWTDETVAQLDAVSWRLMPPAPLGVAWGLELRLRDVYRHKVDELRRTNALIGLILTTSQTVTLDIVCGRWTEATANATETLRLAEEIGAEHGASQCRNSLAWLASLRGDQQAVTELTSRTLELSIPRGVRALTAAAYWHRGQAALFAGRPGESLEDLLRLTEPGHHAEHPTFALLAAEDTVEAACRAGRAEQGAAALRPLQEWADRTGAPWAVAAAYRSAALLATDDAEDLFQRALQVPGAAERPFCYARTRLLYGEWLRRARRRTDARVQLAEAAEVFRRLGAVPMLERSLNEQELTGQQLRRTESPKGSMEAPLTPQELRVAKLAADGLTNREIAAQLLISPRTVGHHLSSVFPKLGIVGRGELARVDFENGLRLTVDSAPVT
ncbi:helix-turn-helix transcriptional regulator [Nocardia colli]|uniref:helix-turn-helix transcriptional regulator n=1 Tax=Nocardia colli TaxID=2545717 RepID=UPI0035DE6EAE